MYPQLQNFLFGLLPNYYRLNDTYKDINDRGLLERYLSIFGLELDTEVQPLADDYLRIINPFETDTKFLNDIAYTVGNPPDIITSPNDYAKLLAYIIQVYKIKGTKRSYELLFSLLGYNVSIVELPPNEGNLLDEAKLLDDGHLLDMGCPGCSEYELIINELVSETQNSPCYQPVFTSLNNTTLSIFTKIVELNQPINAKLKSIVPGSKACETVNLCISNNVTISILTGLSLDDGFLMDEGYYLDGDNIIDQIPISEGCNLNQNGIGTMIIGNTFIIG